jgi:hypothetical protein
LSGSGITVQTPATHAPGEQGSKSMSSHIVPSGSAFGVQTPPLQAPGEQGSTLPSSQEVPSVAGIDMQLPPLQTPTAHGLLRNEQSTETVPMHAPPAHSPEVKHGSDGVHVTPPSLGIGTHSFIASLHVPVKQGSAPPSAVVAHILVVPVQTPCMQASFTVQ